MARKFAIIAGFLLLLAIGTQAQSVPNVIRFNGIATDETHAPITGASGATFAIYEEETGGAALWMETQNVHADAQGHYSVVLGSASREGLPVEIFGSGQARWLGVSYGGDKEQRRVLLVSVPYALKAGDATTLGGHPIGDFVTLDAGGHASQPDASGATPAATKRNVRQETNGKLTPTVQANGQATFTDTDSTQVVLVTQNGTGKALAATNNGNTAAVSVANAATSGTSAFGILSTTNSSNGAAVRGEAFGTSSANIGIWGITHGSGGTGILGEAASTTGVSYGLRGKTASDSGIGLQGQAFSASGSTVGIHALVSSPTGRAMLVDGVGGYLLSARTNLTQVFGVDGNGNAAVKGNVNAATYTGNGAGLTNVVHTVGNLPNRSITFIVGCDTCGLLVDSDDQNTVWSNTIGPMTITNVDCFSDAGAPSINVQRDNGGGGVDILASPLVCTAHASSNSFLSTNNQLSLSDNINFTMVTAGGLAHRVTVVISATVN